MSEQWQDQPGQPGFYWAMPNGEKQSTVVQVQPDGRVLNTVKPLLDRLADYWKWLLMEFRGRDDE